MSRRIGAVATQSVSDFAPGEAKVNGYEFLCFPFRYAVTAGMVPTTDYPFELSLERCMEYFHRFKELRITFSVALLDNPANSFSRQFVLARDTVNEMDLLLPGLDATDVPAGPAACSVTYAGGGTENDWNGAAGSVLAYSASVSMFFRDTRVTERMIFDNELFFPSFALTAEAVFTTPGSDFSATLSNIPFTDSTGTTDVSVFPAHGGAVVLCETNATDPGNMTVTASLEPYRWFEWPDRDGNDPRWDSLTGNEN